MTPAMVPVARLAACFFDACASRDMLNALARIGDFELETLMSKKLTGSFVALITPFNKDGTVDFAAFRALLKFHEENRTSAVLIMGSTGETSMLSPEEKK